MQENTKKVEGFRKKYRKILVFIIQYAPMLKNNLLDQTKSKHAAYQVHKCRRIMVLPLHSTINYVSDSKV